jgi:hypothetical protein
MKTMIGWLSDPFLHLLAIAAIVLAVGTKMSTETKLAEVDVFGPCDICHHDHNLSEKCGRVAVYDTYVTKR